MKIYLIYITTQNYSEAKKISTLLIKERYVACVNIIKSVDSIYRWKGKIINTKESVVIAKTDKKTISKLIKKIKLIHSYDCPCIVTVPIVNGNKLISPHQHRRYNNTLNLSYCNKVLFMVDTKLYSEIIQKKYFLRLI